MKEAGLCKRLLSYTKLVTNFLDAILALALFLNCVSLHNPGIEAAVLSLNKRKTVLYKFQMSATIYKLNGLIRDFNASKANNLSILN